MSWPLIVWSAQAGLAAPTATAAKVAATAIPRVIVTIVPPLSCMKPIIHQTSAAELRAENRIVKGCQMRHLDTIDSELRLVATLRRAARERGGPLQSIAAADTLLDECRELSEGISEPAPDPSLVQR
jgi:hypothetical protein